MEDLKYKNKVDGRNSEIYEEYYNKVEKSKKGSVGDLDDDRFMKKYGM
jgi:hypothetical protein